jgi:hypothetical protein
MELCEVGDKLVLYTTPFPTTDKERIENKTVVITLTEKKADDRGYSFKAIGDDNRVYICPWTPSKEMSFRPYWQWCLETDDHEYWYDVSQGTLTYPSKPAFVDKYNDLIAFCDKHNKVYYILYEEMCVSCLIALTHEERVEYWDKLLHKLKTRMGNHESQR